VIQGLIVQLVVGLAVGVLKHYSARADHRAMVLAEVERQGAQDAIAAYGWKAAHPVVVPTDPGDVFDVAPGAPEIKP
jgi:hypothetical protein